MFYRWGHERQRRKKKVDTSYATISTTSCERVVQGCKFATQSSVRGFLNRRFKWRFWLLLPPRAKVTRPGARNTPPTGGCGHRPRKGTVELRRGRRLCRPYRWRYGHRSGGQSRPPLQRFDDTLPDAGRQQPPANQRITTTIPFRKKAIYGTTHWYRTHGGGHQSIWLL